MTAKKLKGQKDGNCNRTDCQKPVGVIITFLPVNGTAPIVPLKLTD